MEAFLTFTETHERSPAGTDDAQSPSNQESASSAEVVSGKTRDNEEGVHHLW